MEQMLAKEHAWTHLALMEIHATLLPQERLARILANVRAHAQPSLVEIHATLLPGCSARETGPDPCQCSRSRTAFPGRHPCHTYRVAHRSFWQPSRITPRPYMFEPGITGSSSLSWIQRYKKTSHLNNFHVRSNSGWYLDHHPSKG